MKAFVFTILMIAATMNVSTSEQQDTNAPESIGIEVYEKSTLGTNPQERGLSYYEVEAHLYSDSRKVEVNLFNIGNAYVSIVDANGMRVDSIDVSTDMPRTVMLNVAVRGGHYYLIISSSAVYAEGHFSL